VDSFTIQIPEGYQVDEAPSPVSLDVGFASYSSVVKAESRSLHYTRRLEIKELQVLPGEFERVREFYRQISAEQNSLVVLRRK
jgi:hypothetical protein